MLSYGRTLVDSFKKFLFLEKHGVCGFPTCVMKSLKFFSETAHLISNVYYMKVPNLYQIISRNFDPIKHIAELPIATAESELIRFLGKMFLACFANQCSRRR